MTNRGYIALITTIIISAILLSLVAEESFLGFATREHVADTESKEAATALADGCLEHGLALAMQNTLVSGVSSATGVDACTPLAITSQNGVTTLKTQAQVHSAYATLSEQFSTNDIYFGASILPPLVVGASPNLTITPVPHSLRETAN